MSSPATWIVRIGWQDLSLIRRWFRKPDEAAYRAFCRCRVACNPIGAFDPGY